MSGKDEKICCVQPGSIAEEAGIEPGDVLLSVNGEKIRDIFDYRFLTTDEGLLLEVLKGNGEVWEIEVEKDEYEDLGVEFESGMMDEARRCCNQCIFCFIDQLPAGMRETLYFKDDDSRLSFLHGNYVTLTNMGAEDLRRIIRYRMSPVNVSIHTTNPELRISMLRNRHAGDVLEKIKCLVDGGIEVNCQIVLCRGINDQSELDRAIADLAHLYPGVRSISVVPVGLTRYREGLAVLKPYDREAAGEVIRQVEAWQKRFLNQYGSRVVYLADELYILAQREIPACSEYEGFPQIENGVGLVALLKNEFYEYLMSGEHCARGGRTVSIATGVSVCKYIEEMAGRLEAKFKGLTIHVYEIKNRFFGENVTVTGLLTGGDIVSQLDGKDLGEELLISRSMLKADEDIFLDDYTLEQLEGRLGIPVTVVENSGKAFIDKILGSRPDA